jgi:hypothetical protein
LTNILKDKPPLPSTLQNFVKLFPLWRMTSFDKYFGGEVGIANAITKFCQKIA